MRRTLAYYSALGAALACSLTSAPLHASSGPAGPAHARLVVAEAAKAMGGADALRTLRSIAREGTEHWVDTLQQPQPWTGPGKKLPRGQRVGFFFYIDYRTPTYVRVQRFTERPEERFTQSFGATESGGFFRGQFQQEPSLYSTSNADAATRGWTAELKRLPEALVRFALEHPQQASLSTQPNTDGAYDIILIADPALGENRLYVDRRTHLPMKVEFSRDHPIYGDTTGETLFEEYRRTGRLNLPHKVTYRVGGIPTNIYTYRRIIIDSPPPADMLATPANFVKVAPDPDKPELRDLGGGVYVVRGAYNVMFADFHDYVLLSEAPVGESFVLQCLDFIQKVAPGKRVIAVASHFHADHIAGVRALVARGIPIVARPETIEIIRQALAASKTLKPDLLAAHPAKPQFITMTDRTMSFRSSKQSVDVIDVGPTQHSEHLLITYFRNAKAVHVADLWDVPAPDQAIAGNDAELLVNKLGSLGLNVELMVPVHGNPATRAQMDDGLAIRAKYVRRERR